MDATRARRRRALRAAAVGALVLLVVLGVGGAIAAWRCGRAVAAVEAQLLEAPREEMPSEDGLAAGRQLIAAARELGVELVPQDLETRRWCARLAASSDETLTRPPEALASWAAAQRDSLLELAARAAGKPRPAWDDREGQSEAWSLAHALNAAAAVRAEAGDHAEAEQLLRLGWDVHAAMQPSIAGSERPLGVLRRIRVADPLAWLARLQEVQSRERLAQAQIRLASRRWHRAGGEVEARDMPLTTALAGFAPDTLRDRVDAGWFAMAVLREARALREADPCAPLSSAIPGSWRRDQLIWALVPLKTPALHASHELAMREDHEASLRLTEAVLRLRAGDASDPCGLIAAFPAGDGRVTLRWLPDRHAILGDVRFGIREFTLTP